MRDYYGQSEINPVLERVAQNWLRQLERAKRFKQEIGFSGNASECLSYYTSPKDWDQMMGREHLPAEGDLTFKMHVNKAYEFVKIFGPSLYYNNPVRTVKPRAPVQVPGQFFADQMQFADLAMQEQVRVAIDGIRAILLEAYLNWTPSRYGLDTQSRLAIDEALIKGRGLLWTELVESPDGDFRAVSSRFDSVNHLLLDPDAGSVDRCKWASRRCIQPVWEVERDYGLRRGSIKGNMESLATQADIDVDPEMSRRRAAGYTADLLVFYQIWSRMGIGGRLAGSDLKLRTPLDEIFGDNSYIVVCSQCRFPLNLPPDLTNDPERYSDTIRAAEWPIPFWNHGPHPWPFTALDFTPLFDSPWPMAPLMAARGELRFLNWVFSFLAGHIKNASRDLVAVKKSMSEEVKTAILSGSDLALIELEHDHGVITDCVQFLQHPEVNGDIWKYLDAVSQAFDKRMGLSEVMYGDAPQTQPRSAAESNIRNQTAGIRPDDMAQQVEGWQTTVSEKEAFVSRYLLMGDDVKICLGPLASIAWDQYVFTQNTSEAFNALEYRIEAGSTRKPNKEFQVNQMTDAMATLLPVFQAYSQTTGDMQPLNNLISDYCKSRDLDPNRYQLQAAPPSPMLSSPASGQPTPDQQGMAVSPATGQPELG